MATLALHACRGRSNGRGREQVTASMQFFCLIPLNWPAGATAPMRHRLMLPAILLHVDHPTKSQLGR